MNDNTDAGDYQPDLVYTSSEGSNFTNSSSQSGSQFRFRLLNETSLGAVTSVPTQEDNTPWIQDSWRAGGTNGQPLMVGQV
ncbi:MAG: hypothetical protein AAGC88_11205 [Bacteroidota bacterium]